MSVRFFFFFGGGGGVGGSCMMNSFLVEKAKINMESVNPREFFISLAASKGFHPTNQPSMWYHVTHNDVITQTVSSLSHTYASLTLFHTRSRIVYKVSPLFREDLIL